MQNVKKTLKKESFMQGIFSMMFSQVLIKLIGLVYKLYLTNREGFGDEGNAIYSSGFYIYSLLLTLSSVGVPNAISKLVSIWAIRFYWNMYFIFWSKLYSKCNCSNTRCRINFSCIITIYFFCIINLRNKRIF